ncbi:hypothetical protein DQ04_01221130 [Trypanosoma grayi]|uniref:hypothetical protein n=1 Tax=Trypanosoma grayi TaxID=71804 RepID=UPI0004F41174|nr:hypothetical protein DQ04_01221130 [Trypanosoma grayi]KEG13096.1 hypothetical protein DQ04_01221130 [Trypanosoma grayi]
MVPSIPGAEAGFCFETVATDGKTVVVVNVCGHSSVGMALAKNMDAVTESYLDEHGVDNLIVPISVGSPVKCKDKKYAYVVDVVVHPFLTRRCVKSHHLFEHFITRLTNLAIEWILQECGMRLNVRGCRLIPDKAYVESGKEAMHQMLSELAKTFEKETKCESVSTEANETASLPEKLKLNASLKETETKRSPLISEMPVSSGIRKGFLNEARLYGEGGSKECNQPPPDPLLHFPEGLRKKCQVIDTRQLVSTTTQAPETTSMVSKNEGFKAPHPSPSKEPVQQWSVESVRCGETEIVVRLKPPLGVKSMKDVDLTASPDSIEVGETDVKLPRTISVDDVSAKFLKSSMTMIVTCPLA